ncbi:mRNA 3'-end-processing protein Yth1p [Diutina catenulata]
MNMLGYNSPIHPSTKGKRLKFEPFLRKEYGLGLDPDRPVCQYFVPQQGPASCPNGTNCPNKHVSPMYSNKIVCKHWLRGLCKKNDHCEFLHEYNLRKMPECLFYSKNGFCTQTPECLYLHIDPQLKIAECMNYNRGFCPDGPECTKRHVRKIMCPLYLTGFCPKGPECEFGHPRFDQIVGKMRIKPDPKIAAALAEKESEDGKPVVDDKNGTDDKKSNNRKRTVDDRDWQADDRKRSNEKRRTDGPSSKRTRKR